MDQGIEEPIGARDVLLGVIGRGCFALATLGVTAVGFSHDWSAENRMVAFAIPASLWLVLSLREKHRLSRFAVRVEESHPGILRTHGIRGRVSWFTADAGSLAALARDEAIHSDGMLGPEAASVRLLWKAEWGVFAAALAVAATGITLLAYNWGSGL